MFLCFIHNCLFMFSIINCQRKTYLIVENINVFWKFIKNKLNFNSNYLNKLKHNEYFFHLIFQLNKLHINAFTSCIHKTSVSKESQKHHQKTVSKLLRDFKIGILLSFSHSLWTQKKILSLSKTLKQQSNEG